jgi:F0F1-type ATP synthase assembly protein I
MSASSPLRALSVAGLIGLDLAACTLIGAWMGRKADHWLGTEPLGLIIGLLVGLLAGLFSIIPIIRKLL